jgi:hypothetical protein
MRKQISVSPQIGYTETSSSPGRKVGRRCFCDPAMAFGPPEERLTGHD